MLSKIAAFLFWGFTILVMYVYFGYPMILILLRRFRSQSVTRRDIRPSVSLIVAAYNEEKVIAQKLENCLSLDYPSDRLEIIVGSDGSTDETNDIVMFYAPDGVELVAESANRGKTSIQNRAVKESKGRILVFTDATGMLQKDALRKLVRNFADPRVGCVVGRVVDGAEGTTSVTAANNIYWAYEVFLRSMESETGLLAAASGSLFAVRRCLYRKLPDFVGDDFGTPLNVLEQSYRVVYEPQATSRDELSDGTREKFTQKTRIVSKDLSGLFYKRVLLNPVLYPAAAFGLVSHKLLRWLVPFFLIGIFASNLLLLNQVFYQAFMVTQLLLYLAGLIGWYLERKGHKLFVFYVPFYFCLLNSAAALGVLRFLSGEQVSRWDTIR